MTIFEISRRAILPRRRSNLFREVPLRPSVAERVARFAALPRCSAAASLRQRSALPSLSD
jgi:hypothetical protein